MSVYELTRKLNLFFADVLDQKCRVLSMLPGETGWKAVCEVIVDPEYTTRKGLGDIVEIYDIFLDDTLEVTGFTMRETKRRAALDNER